MIAVDHLTKYFGRTPGVNQVSFTVEPGEIFGFLGPNGAGKTTTIRLILDLLRPDSGQIRLFNIPLHENSLEIRKRCGYLPGDFSVYENMTGEAFLKFSSRLRHTSYPQMDELIDLLKLRKDLSRKIKQLSQGTRQKLGIIQAFAHQPELVILDEPTGGLDPLIKNAFYQFIDNYQSQGNTIFLSSHNLPEVEKICHRVAIIRQGKLVALEKIDTLKKKRYRKLILELHQPWERIEIEGTRLLESHGNRYTLLITGELLQVLQSLGKLPIRDIVFPEPDLEEVFMYYYRGDQND